MIKISCLEDFVARKGALLFVSDPQLITKDQIQDFCRSIDQLDWFHFDEARANKTFGGIIAPGTMTIPLIHPTYFKHVELINLRALFLGMDRFRVISPLQAEWQISLEFTAKEIVERDEGFAVYYDFVWRNAKTLQEISVGTTIVRYWPE